MYKMKEMLLYQEIDNKVKKIESEIAESVERKNATKMQQYLKEYQAKLVQLNEKSKQIKKTYEQYKKVFENMVKSMEVVSKKIDDKDLGKLEAALEADDTILENLNKLEMEVVNMQKSAEQISVEYANIMKNARTAKSNLSIYKEAFLKLKTTKEKEIEVLKKDLDAQAKKVDKNLLSKYLAKRNDKNVVFVKLNDGKCGGCRMEIPANTVNKIKNGAVVECENCGRLVYVD